MGGKPKYWSHLSPHPCGTCANGQASGKGAVGTWAVATPLFLGDIYSSAQYVKEGARSAPLPQLPHAPCPQGSKGLHCVMFSHFLPIYLSLYVMAQHRLASSRQLPSPRQQSPRGRSPGPSRE